MIRTQPFWKAALKSLGFVLLFEASQYLTATVVQLFSLLRAETPAALSSGELENVLKQIYYPVLYETMFLAAFLFLLVVALIYLFRPQTSFSGAVMLKKTSPLSVVSAVFLGFGSFFLASLLVNLTTMIPFVSQSAAQYGEQMEEIESAIESGGRLWVDLLYTVIGAPVVEEVLCRGLILGELSRASSERTAILLSAGVFAVIHGNVYQFIFTFPLGILLGYLAVKFKSVLPSIVLHAAFNGSNYLPILGQYLGYSEEDAVYLFLYYASIGLFVISIPIGILLLLQAIRGKAPVTTRSPRKNIVPAVPGQTAPYEWKREEETMAAPEWIVAGLGNPGEKYASTRHNAGFIAMDYLALREGLDFSRLRFRAQTAEKEIDGKKVLFLKPQTFMNLSGESIREAAAFYRIPPERILVLSDDVNFEPGVIRIRREGSAGGHNGLKSIIECLGSEAFPRVRIGVGAVPPERDLVGWVLGTLPDDAMNHLVATLEDVRHSVRCFVAGDLDRAMSECNGKTR